MWCGGAWIACGAAALLLGLPVGSYVALVTPIALLTPKGEFEQRALYLKLPATPSEWEWNNRIEPIFAPMNWLDRRIRSEMWKPPSFGWFDH